MPKGEKKLSHDNKPKLSVKEKAERKANKKAKVAPTVIAPSKR